MPRVLLEALHVIVVGGGVSLFLYVSLWFLHQFPCTNGINRQLLLFQKKKSQNSKDHNGFLVPFIMQDVPNFPRSKRKVHAANTLTSAPLCCWNPVSPKRNRRIQGFAVCWVILHISHTQAISLYVVAARGCFEEA